MRPEARVMPGRARADLGDLAEVPQEVIEHGTPASVRLSRGAWSPRFESRAGRRSTHLPPAAAAGSTYVNYGGPSRTACEHFSY
jgi:hypothetical protein